MSVCQGSFVALFCTQGNLQREAIIQKSPLQRTSRLGLSSATLAFRKMSAWLLEPDESGSQRRRSEGQHWLCVMWKGCSDGGWGQGGGAGVCVCVKLFWEVTPSCQSCLGSISGLFRGVNTPVQQPFCPWVRPRLPPSESWSHSQRAENTPH